MDLDFIEIGTSNFGTLIQNCADDEYGISIEPVKYYLDMLPNKPNVIKINKAITGDLIHDNHMRIYYIPEDDIIKNGLNSWFKGCNKVGEYHPLHIKHKVTHLVKNDEIEIIYIGSLLREFDIKKIGFLKIDTEGHDLNIMNGFFNYIKDLPDIFHPKKIQFETNEYSLPKDVDKTIKLYSSLGYEITYRKQDTIIQKIKDINYEKRST